MKWIESRLTWRVDWSDPRLWDETSRYHDPLFFSNLCAYFDSAIARANKIAPWWARRVVVVAGPIVFDTTPDSVPCSVVAREDMEGEYVATPHMGAIAAHLVARSRGTSRERVQFARLVAKIHPRLTFEAFNRLGSSLTRESWDHVADIVRSCPDILFVRDCPLLFTYIERGGDPNLMVMGLDGKQCTLLTRLLMAVSAVTVLEARAMLLAMMIIMHGGVRSEESPYLTEIAEVLCLRDVVFGALTR